MCFEFITLSLFLSAKSHVMIFMKFGKAVFLGDNTEHWQSLLLSMPVLLKVCAILLSVLKVCRYGLVRRTGSSLKVTRAYRDFHGTLRPKAPFLRVKHTFKR